MAITAAVLYAQNPVSTEALRAAAGPVEAWIGKPLVIYTGAVLDPPPVLRARQFPQPLDPSEAVITPDAIYVPLARFLAFRNGQELAAFLAHASAHAKLRHPERMAEVMTEVAILNTTHAPEKIASNLEVRTRTEMERDATATAVEFMNSSGCTPTACAMFESLLRASPRP
jgi:hypothetical protein